MAVLYVNKGIISTKKMNDVFSANILTVLTVTPTPLQNVTFASQDTSWQNTSDVKKTLMK